MEVMKGYYQANMKVDYSGDETFLAIDISKLARKYEPEIIIKKGKSQADAKNFFEVLPIPLRGQKVTLFIKKDENRQYERIEEEFRKLLEGEYRERPAA